MHDYLLYIIPINSNISFSYLFLQTMNKQYFAFLAIIIYIITPFICLQGGQKDIAILLKRTINTLQKKKVTFDIDNCLNMTQDRSVWYVLSQNACFCYRRPLQLCSTVWRADDSGSVSQFCHSAGNPLGRGPHSVKCSWPEPACLPAANTSLYPSQ